MAPNKYDYYGFTINVSPKKYLNGKQWQDYEMKEQEMILRKVIDLWKPRCGYYEPGSFDVQYELTKKGMIHAHGGLMTDLDEMITFQNKVHDYLGFPNLKKDICFNYSKTLISTLFWSRYMHKESTEQKAINFLLNLKVDSDKANDNDSM